MYNKIQPLLADFYSRFAQQRQHPPEEASRDATAASNGRIIPRGEPDNGTAPNLTDAVRKESTASTLPDNADFNSEDFDDLFDKDDNTQEARDCDQDTSAAKRPFQDQTDHSDPEEGESENSAPVSTSSGDPEIQSPVTPGLKTLPQVFPNAAAAFSNAKDFESLEYEALRRHITNVVQDMQTDLERLQTMWIVAYEELDNATGRDVCYAVLEQPYFRSTWGYILTLYR